MFSFLSYFDCLANVLFKFFLNIVVFDLKILTFITGLW